VNKKTYEKHNHSKIMPQLGEKTCGRHRSKEKSTHNQYLFI